MKKGWDRYATEKRYKQKGYLRKYRNGNASWKTPEASGSNSLQQSGKGKEEVIVRRGDHMQLVLKEDVMPNEPFLEDGALSLNIYKECLQETEDQLIKELQDEGEARIWSKIQRSRKGCSEVGSEESGSGSSSSGNEKVRKRTHGKDGSSRKKKS